MPHDPTADWPANADATADYVSADSTSPSGNSTPHDWPTIPGYTLTAELARGGMGRVFAACDVSLDRDVAIKTLLPGANAKRFLIETKITAKLNHPGIPPLHALGTLGDGTPFLAMKLVRGRTLGAMLHERPTPETDRQRFLQIVSQIAQAVGYAHSEGIIHRDLKPANVMVGAFGEVQVMDWGLAKVLGYEDNDTTTTLHASEHTQDGAVMGTPGYMAPEQARGEPAGPPADVFAFGSLLAHVLTGKPAIVGPNIATKIRRTANAELDDVHERLEACGAEAELLAIAQRCLAANPDDRYADGQQVAMALADYQAAAEQRAKEAELERNRVAVQLTEERKRRRVRQALTLVLTLFFCGIVGFIWWQDQQSRERRTITKSRDDLATAKQETADALGREQVAHSETERLRSDAVKAKGDAEAARDDARNARAQIAKLEYARRMNLVSRELLNRNYDAVQRLLEDCPTELRGWEWHYAKRASQPYLQTLVGHHGRIRTGAYSPDGTRFVSLSDEGAMCVWDSTKWKLLKSHTLRADQIAFAPDGATFTVNVTQELATFHTATGEATETVPITGGFLVKYAPNGKTLAVIVQEANQYSLLLYDLTNKKIIHTLARNLPVCNAVAYSPDSKLVATTQGLQAHVWEVATGKEVVRVDSLPKNSPFPAGPPPMFPKGGPGVPPMPSIPHRERGHDSLAFTADSKALVTRMGVYELPTGKQRHAFDIDAGYEWSKYAIAPTGDRVFIPRSMGRQELLTLQGDRIERRLVPLTNGTPLRFSGDGKYLLFQTSPSALGGGVSGFEGDIGLIESNTGNLLTILKRPNESYVSEMRPDAKELVTGRLSGQLHVWQLHLATPLQLAVAPTGPGQPPQHRWTGHTLDQRYYVESTNTKVRIIDQTTGKATATIDLPAIPEYMVYRLQLAPTSKHLSISNPQTGLLEFRELASGKVLSQAVAPRFGPDMDAHAFSPDGTRVVIMETNPPRLVVRKSADWSVLLAQEQPALATQLWLRFASDGKRCFFVTGNGTLYALDLATHQLHELERLSTPIQQAPFAPNGAHVLLNVGDEWHLRDTATGKKKIAVPWVRNTRGPEWLSPPPGFASNSEWFYLVNNGVTFYDVRDGRKLFELNTPRVQHVLVFPHGNRLLTSGEDGVYLWDVTSREAVYKFSSFPWPVFMPNQMTLDPTGYKLRVLVNPLSPPEEYDGTPLLAKP